ncbi:MAG TPA: TlpA disulfide reductase family protein [Vicinamibacterales bacterium]|nr:TlpA disulfide reductase family protein [Vicinamibacterales bacterium]
MPLPRLATAAAIVALTLQAAPGADLPAVVETGISHGEVRVEMIMAPATPDQRETLRGLVPDDVPISKGTLVFPQGSGSPLYLADLGGDAFVVLGDFNRDDRIAPEERVPLSGRLGAPAAVAQVRIAGGQFAAYPVAFREPRQAPRLTRADGTRLPDRLMMKVSVDVVLRGSVAIDGKPLAFELPIDAQDGRLHLDRNVHLLDVDGDGGIDRDLRSRERMTALGAPPVFRIGERYLSIATVDIKAGRATFAARTAADYERIEIDRGAMLPDFGFVDLEGRTRRLSEFRGKHTLLDFWGTWCGPCVAELPFLARAYAEFHERGFEIIGMDYEKPDLTPEDLAAGVEHVRAFVRERELGWPQARTDSIKRLFERRFQIGVWPTMILIDPSGRVISAGRADRGEPALKGEALLHTLTALLPARAH